MEITKSGFISIFFDEELKNADWTKSDFDLMGIKTPLQLRNRLKKLGISLNKFRTLPAYQGWLKDQEQRAKP